MSARTPDIVSTLVFDKPTAGKVRMEGAPIWMKGETVDLGAVQYLDVPDDYAGNYRVRDIKETHLKGGQVRLTYDMRRSRIQPN